jgi:hypothetical protein
MEASTVLFGCPFDPSILRFRSLSGLFALKTTIALRINGSKGQLRENWK